ncbi:SRPBCC family protein [Dechloromonas sp. XY25]|uniref:SRPBCC family protein n=1 Tax=Dechloromonas hankyongensis TaxID=2908002 RepID=A0ABS9K2U2_9RHOO|nr:SRPBCC family protein [Dechloromonas hankyongensis]MCG2577463.1 SRPBCC family protein [Dechloromonas hankyongensis]
MPASLRVLSMLLLAGLARPGLALTDDDVTVAYKDGSYTASLRVRTPAPPAIVLAVLTDFDHMAEFMPGLESSRIVANQGNSYQVAQRGKVKFGPFSMSYESMRQIEVVDGQRILSRSLAGSARRMQSEMRIQPLEHGTRIEYHIEIEPESWIPSSLGTNFMQHELAEQFNALTKEMFRRH